MDSGYEKWVSDSFTRKQYSLFHRKSWLLSTSLIFTSKPKPNYIYNTLLKLIPLCERQERLFVTSSIEKEETSVTQNVTYILICILLQ